MSFCLVSLHSVNAATWKQSESIDARTAKKILAFSGTGSFKVFPANSNKVVADLTISVVLR
ncbi:hypothetical protein [Parashewanella spongiae]|uniref:hypothetical protein n=1 Tax=Parashewanella spongiae TaxID=342950 RepID=UPI00105A3012|nr:hypothetical protein [Parashewanella spongiae]